MEMITTGEASKQEARIRFTLDGRPVDAEISQVKLSTTTVSFLAMLAGRLYQFAGALRNSDYPFWDVSAAMQVRAGKLRTMAITLDYVRAFFEGCLKGQWGGLRKLAAEAGKTFPGVSAQKFGAMWP
jgi:hypothetical protein